MKSLELFAGIGGITLGAEWAGVETVAFCERDPFCQKILNKHWPDVPIFDDIKTLNKQALEERGIDVESIELISGGFPCQPFSVAGNKKGKEDDRDLWPEMFRIIKELKPRWIVGENVANFVNMELDRTLFNLESIGYRWRTFVIPACAVDAKHRRDRTFVVAYSDSFGCDNREDNRKERPVQSELNGNSSEGEQEREGRVDRVRKIRPILSDSPSIGLPGSREFIEPIDSTKNRKRETSKPFNVRIPSEWKSEPRMGRVANGIPDQMDRIRALGNAVVPQQIYPIFKTIMEIEGAIL
jgi:DNA (cytosine-5)-methyltransferase 1